MYDVLMLLKCSGLQYDDRVRKECNSLKGEGFNTEIHVVENDNGSGSGVIYSSDTAFVKHSLLLRRIFSGNKFLLLKLFELFFRILPTSIKKHKVIWLHDPLMFVFVPYFALLRKFGRCDKIVWDQHELPPQFILNKKLLRKAYTWSMQLADIKIHANKSRAEYLNEKLGCIFDYKVLNNFVDDDLLNELAQPLSENIKRWLGGDEFVLLQSGAYTERHFNSVAEAICLLGNVKCIVVGGRNINLEHYRERYSNFDDVFFFVGMIPQIRLVDYIDAAKVSLILYDAKEPNSFLCEPNRLYQASSRGTRVVAGNNPPMSDFISENNCGVVLADDGSNYKYIYEVLKKEMHGSNQLDKIVAANWSSQRAIFKSICN